MKVGQTTASEFGGLNVSGHRLHGVTHNPWEHGRTAGGSSGGSAAVVAGGLVPIATGGDGGGSIRIPAGFCGLVGMKGTAGRIPRGPRTEIAPLTVVSGCLARSVRDVARWYDVCAGYDTRDPYSLPSDRGVGARPRHPRPRGPAGRHRPGPRLRRGRPGGRGPWSGPSARRWPATPACGWSTRDVHLPGLGYEWAMANLAQLRRELGDRWPDCKDGMTLEMAFGLELAEQVFDLELAARVEAGRDRGQRADGRRLRPGRLRGLRHQPRRRRSRPT